MFFDLFVMFSSINWCSRIYLVMFGSIFSSFYLTIINNFTNFIFLFFTFHDTCDVHVVYIWCSMLYFVMSASTNVTFYNVFMMFSIHWCSRIYFVMFGSIFSSFYLTLINYFTNFIILFYIFHDFCDVHVVYIWCSMLYLAMFV